jgi:DNA-binding IscR family transcriptional regulator
LSAVSEELKLSTDFLQQVANKLMKASILSSRRGRNGGYELKDDPSIKEILLVFMSLDIVPNYSRWTGPVECRAFKNYIHKMRVGLDAVLSNKISTINSDLVEIEVALRESSQMNGVLQ